MPAPPVPCTQRGICVDFPWNLRARAVELAYKRRHRRQRVRRKEPPMPPEPDLIFPPFRLDLEHAQLWRGTEQVPLRPGGSAAVASCGAAGAACIGADSPQDVPQDV
jgi:hypothetical protein